MDSGIGWAHIKYQGKTKAFETDAPVISYKSSDCPGKCYCLIQTDQCFPYQAEALINNCLFLGKDTTNSSLVIQFMNQAGLPSTPIPIMVGTQQSTPRIPHRKSHIEHNKLLLALVALGIPEDL